MLYGKTGVGKSHLAASIVRRKIDVWIPWAFQCYGESAMYMAPQGKFVSILAFKKVLQSYWGSKTGGAESEKIIRFISQASLVVLDDLGREQKTPSFIETMDEIAEGREKARRQTIITTNMDPKRIRERYGAAFYSRMILPATIIEMKGPDQRARRNS